MTPLRTVPGTVPARRHERIEPPAPRKQAAYSCARGHTFAVTFAAEAETPKTWACRCGAQAGAPAAAAGAEDDRERHRRFVMERRSPAERKRALAVRLAEVAMMRQAGQILGP
jgi:hypothetical protein